MNNALTLNLIIDIIAVIVAIVGGLKAIEYLIQKITDKYNKDNQIDVQKEELDKFKTDTDSQLREIKEEQCMLTYCMIATLDGLNQLGCNGKVTEARAELDKFMNKQAHEVK